MWITRVCGAANAQCSGLSPQMNKKLPLCDRNRWDDDGSMNEIDGHAPAAGALSGNESFIREHASARARRLRIEVHADGEVRLIYPQSMSRVQALRYLQAQSAWIHHKRNLLLASLPKPSVSALRWDGSDLFPLHGREVPLHSVPTSAATTRLRISDEAISLFVAARDREQPARLERVFLQGLQRHALQSAVALAQTPAAALGVQCGLMRVRDPRTQWGSCAADGRITLSWRLVMAPREVFRYVVVHELCHLREMNHSPRFWSLVAAQHPTYAQERDWLRRHGAKLTKYLPRPSRQGGAC